MNLRKTQIIFGMAVGTLTASALSANSVLYLENFSHLGEFTRPATETGWKGFWTGGSPSAAHNLAELADPDGVRRNSPLGNPGGVNNNPVPGAEVGVVFSESLK